MAGELSRLGRWVLIPPFKEHAKTREEALDFVDSGDLFLVERPEQVDDLERIRCETKNQTERQGAWTSAADYGIHPGRDRRLEKFFICSVGAWNRAEAARELPFNFYYLNHTWTHYAHVRRPQVDPRRVFECKAGPHAVFEDTKAIWIPTDEVNF